MNIKKYNHWQGRYEALRDELFYHSFHETQPNGDILTDILEAMELCKHYMKEATNERL